MKQTEGGSLISGAGPWLGLADTRWEICCSWNRGGEKLGVPAASALRGEPSLHFEGLGCWIFCSSAVLDRQSDLQKALWGVYNVRDLLTGVNYLSRRTGKTSKEVGQYKRLFKELRPWLELSY
jgi:hypothetical protein